MDLSAFTVEPLSLPLGKITVSTLISLNQSNDIWDVVIVFARVPAQNLIKGDEVNAQLLDSQGTALKMLERPSGSLVEAGGSLSVSANALFRFQGSNSAPAHLVVTYKGQTVCFRILGISDAS